MLAMAKRVEGEISSALLRTERRRLSAVSLRPGATSQNLSVLAVHSTITCHMRRGRRERGREGRGREEGRERGREEGR